MTSTSIPSIPKFYTGKNIFITGATGFLGKALIEKLLRSCPGIGDIYILVRPKRGKELMERVAVLIADPLFERVKKEQPNLKMENKIKPVAGDMIKLNLGLSPKDRQMIVDKVNIIFHIAASVRFDDPLKEAVIMNVRGTREACQLALDAKNLCIHVHVSTAFANCDRPKAEEVLYPQKIEWQKMIEIAEKFDPLTLKALTEKIMDGMPNTYCFTKNVAEHVANEMLQGKIPCKIFRPSIVVSTLRDEPVKGWIDNFNGPVGILVAYGKGIMRTVYAHDLYKPDYIPVDVVTKALVVSTWDLAVRKQKQKPEILQCTSHNSAEWLRPNLKRLAKSALDVNKNIPLNDMLWVPSTHTTTSPAIMYIRTVLFMLLPSMMIDGLLKLMRKKPMLTKLQKKIYVAQLALRHFMNNEWAYPNTNLLALQNTIQEGDKQDWDYDFKHESFHTYIANCFLGCRRYLLKETDETLPAARKHYKRLRILDKILHIVGIVLICVVLWNFGVVSYGFQKIKL